jgi:hypothetical protein
MYQIKLVEKKGTYLKEKDPIHVKFPPISLVTEVQLGHLEGQNCPNCIVKFGTPTFIGLGWLLGVYIYWSMPANFLIMLFDIVKEAKIYWHVHFCLLVFVAILMC